MKNEGWKDRIKELQAEMDRRERRIKGRAPKEDEKPHVSGWKQEKEDLILSLQDHRATDKLRDTCERGILQFPILVSSWIPSHVCARLNQLDFPTESLMGGLFLMRDPLLLGVHRDYFLRSLLHDDSIQEHKEAIQHYRSTSGDETPIRRGDTFWGFLLRSLRKEGEVTLKNRVPVGVVRKRYKHYYILLVPEDIAELVDWDWHFAVDPIRGWSKRTEPKEWDNEPKRTRKTKSISPDSRRTKAQVQSSVKQEVRRRERGRHDLHTTPSER